MTEHTQGPWVASGTLIHEATGPMAQAVATTIVGRSSYERRVANARLMAAAPDLLAACEALLDALAFSGASYTANATAVDAARAAIAKAKGDTNG